MDKRWSIYIDIEGFGARYDQTMAALIPLNALMEGIYLVGSKKYDDDVNRLFAHQFGDGFVIVSCFEEEKLDRATSIAIALMRHVLASGGLAKASISEGGFSDIKSCYPKPVTDNEQDGVVSIGAGLMTIIPVMGTALINAVSVDKRSPSGSLLTIDSTNKDRISSNFQSNGIESNLHSINWLIGEHDLVNEILAESGLKIQSEEERITTLRKYIKDNKLKPSWIRTTCFEQNISI
ncbi:hypothetical protein [Marinobacter sp. SS13-12]|uniref:hypothetical protein n=1 Tax=Marinobacter sp. SS13-12 TaxID=3050451 RepID=UPI00255518B7|nr:hypothetical protein [Marinobacter sp. SS13-12]MDK8465145.1 hypothetical protein [Marinobacter sp. SS13-12]